MVPVAAAAAHHEAGGSRRRSLRALLLINMSFLCDSGRRGHANDVKGRCEQEVREKEREKERWGE